MHGFVFSEADEDELWPHCRLRRFPAAPQLLGAESVRCVPYPPLSRPSHPYLLRGRQQAMAKALDTRFSP
jgi:hypothetical protein